MSIPPELPAAAGQCHATAGSPTAPEPFLFAVAANMHRLMHLSREAHLGLWKRVVELYSMENKPLPEFVRNLCQEPFVESLLHNEVFWSLAGCSQTRHFYGHANAHLSAVYATAALLAASRDNLPLSAEEYSLLSGGCQNSQAQHPS